jgi:purine-cytosine permease-like protein
MFGRDIPIPASRLGRIALGVTLVLFGFLGFLPILGFWMVPLGLFILSVDLAIVRRMRRRVAVWWERRKAARRKPDA